MLEVCFESSVKGCLALAQCCGGDIIGGAVGIITDKKGVSAFFAKRKALKEYYKKQRELHRRAVPLGGTREEIAEISFGLSEGDIHSPICPGGVPEKGIYPVGLFLWTIRRGRGHRRGSRRFLAGFCLGSAEGLVRPAQSEDLA